MEPSVEGSLLHYLPAYLESRGDQHRNNNENLGNMSPSMSFYKLFSLQGRM
jgi:hypothetical protein